MGSRLFLAALVLFLLVPTVHAQDFSSTHYTVLAPVLQPGGYATSTSFGLQSILTQLSAGTSSATTFGGNIGFLFYPQVSTPTLSASGGDAQASLSWSASSAYLGWTVGAYSVG